MTVRENLEQHCKAMALAGIDINLADIYGRDVLAQHGNAEVLSVKNKKGRKGQVYTILHTAAGDVRWFPGNGDDPALYFEPNAST